MRSCRVFPSARRVGGRRRYGTGGDWISNAFRVARTPYFARGKLYQIWVGGFPGVEIGFDAAHSFHILHRTFFAGGDDHALLTRLERHLGGERRMSAPTSAPPVCTWETTGRHLPEVAARAFAVRSAVTGLANGVQADEGR